MNRTEERLNPFIVIISSVFLTDGIIGDQEIQINPVVLIISQLKIEELVLRIITIPRSDLYLITPPLCIESHLLNFILILPCTWIDIEFRQDLNGDQCAIQTQLRILR